MASNVSSNRMQAAYGESFEKNIARPGGFINYGFWRDIDVNRILTNDDWIRSQEALYRRVLKSLEIKSADRVLEVGSGIGRGTALAMSEFSPRKVCGVDLIDSQVERSKKVNAAVIDMSDGRLSFEQGAADALPFADGLFEKIYTVEAIQHFPSLDRFITEVIRVASRPVRIAITSDFTPSANIGIEQWQEFFDHADGFVQAYPITDLVAALERRGFVEINVEKIGEDVFPGYAAWLTHAEGKPPQFAEKILSGYKMGLWDYYLLNAAYGIE